MKAQVSVETLFVITFMVSLFIVTTNSVYHRKTMLESQEFFVEVKSVCNSFSSKVADATLLEGLETNMTLKGYNLSVQDKSVQVLSENETVFCNMITSVTNGSHSDFNISQEVVTIQNLNGGVVIS
ncbi:MAG: hypothetical protein GOU97_04435 [Nanoarchaeota archaeon]|nr:hypothetical protein [Nanoarchaeota archaeon]